MKYFYIIYMLVFIVIQGGCSNNHLFVSSGELNSPSPSSPTPSPENPGPPLPAPFVDSSWLIHLGLTTQSNSPWVSSTSAEEACKAIALDGSGNVYCAGYTKGSLAEPNGGGNDAFVMKLNPSGGIEWMTQLGATTQTNSSHVLDTSANDQCHAVTVDGDGNVYCAGDTNGNLAETNGSGASRDAFMMKLNSSGGIEWIKQFGFNSQSSPHINDTSDQDSCQSIALDSSNNVYCAGYTMGDFAENNGSGSSSDGIIIKLDPNGNILWAKQIGADTQATSIHVNDATKADECNAISIDGNDNIFCAGGTSGDLAETNGGGFNLDIFILKLNSSGTIEWVKQVGSDTQFNSTLVNNTFGNDRCLGVTTDDSGNIYCTGYTTGALAGPSGGSDDAFVIKFNSSGGIEWLTQLNAAAQASSPYVNDASSTDRAYAVQVDGLGNVYAVGETLGNLNATIGPGGNDAFVMKLNSSGTIEWLTHLGTNLFSDPGYFSTQAYALAVNTQGNAYFAGKSAGVLNEADGGGLNGDLMVGKLKLDGSLDL